MSTTKVITGKVRFSYVNIFKSRAFQAGQDAKYSVCLLIPKEDKATIKKIKAAIDAAVQDGTVPSGAARSRQPEAASARRRRRACR